MEILYHDRHIAVCRKEPGLLSEAGTGSVPEKLAEALSAAPESIYVVHRLDRTTGGLMVYARTKKAAAHLSEEIREGRFRKEYLALAEGVVTPDTGEMTDWLYFDRTRNRSYVVKKRNGAREARLTYTVVRTLPSPYEETDRLSLCRVRLETGRTHQIRVQFAARQHPLAGDRKYGAAVHGSLSPLWSAYLGFTHPTEGFMEFSLAEEDVMERIGLTP